MWFDTRVFSFLNQLSIMHSLRVNIASRCAIYFFFGFCLPVYFALGLRLLSEKAVLPMLIFICQACAL